VFTLLEFIRVLFRSKLADDALRPRATRTDTRSLRIHLGIVALHADFGTISGLARHRLDGHSAVRYFRNLQLKQPPHKVHVGAAEDQFRSARRRVDFQQKTTNALAGSVVLTTHLTTRQKRLRL